MVKAIIFDLWDTLMQSMSITGALRERFTNLQPDIVRVCEEAIMIGKHDLAEMAEILLEALDQPLTDENITFVKQVFTEARNSAQIIPGVPELLAKLKERYTLVVLSNTASFSSDALTTAGLAPYFAHEFYSWEIEALKPHAESFMAVCERMRLHPEECILIDDNLGNVTAAEDLGMGAIHFIGVDGVERELEQIGIL